MSAIAEPIRVGVHRRILGAAAGVTVAAAIAKCGGLVREFVVAGVYGRSEAFEAFVLAALIPGLIINLVSESMNQALVPTFVRVRELEGRAQAQRLLSNASSVSVLLLITISAVLAASAHIWFAFLGSQYSQAKLELAIRLFYSLLPVTAVMGVATTCTAILNTEGQFSLPAIAPIATTAATILCVWFFRQSSGIWAMVYGAILGAIVHSLWMLCMLRGRGYSVLPRWRGMTDATREVVGQYGPVFLSSVVASGGLLVDQAMAAMLSPGSVSALAYASRIISVALALLGGPIATAVTPVFSELVARCDWEACRRIVNVWSWSSAAAGGALALLLIVAAHPLIRLTLQRGAFRPQDTSAVAPVLMMYAIQVPFFVGSRVFYRFLIAMRRTDLVFYCGGLNLVLDIALNLVLMHSLGVAGIALATSLWNVSTFVFLCYWSWRVLSRERNGLAVRSA